MSFTDIPAPHGRLEALHWKVDNAQGAVVVCHPNPLQGGTMHSHIPYRTADAFRKAGVGALRFNFRGVGRSTGTHDDGNGEVDDAALALNWMANAYPGLPLYVAGFSFRSRVALRLAMRDTRIKKVLAMGVPLDIYDFGFTHEVKQPKAFIHADHDEFAPLDKVRTFVETLLPPTKLWVVDNCDHLATGKLDAFSDAATQAVEWILSD